MPKRFALAALGLLLVTAAWAQEAQKPEACSHPKGWKPTTDENLLAWLQKNRDKDEDLCNIDLSGAELANADLGLRVEFGANGSVREHTVKLNGANLSHANLSGANLSHANLSGAKLQEAKLDGADLYDVSLSGADLTFANLSGANLHPSDLSGARLDRVKLDGADLSFANLKGADVFSASVVGTKLAYANLTEARYSPASAPPDSYVAGIQGLSTVRFPVGEETGLIQLRDLLQKAGLRDLEREVTFAIERGETRHALRYWQENPPGAAEGIFRYLAFDLTTAYGLWPSRALLVIAALWLLLIPIYAWPIWQAKRPPAAGSVYRIWPEKRIEVHEHKPTLDNPARIERLHGRGLAAIGWAAYFSLLSAFQIGYREFSVGSWLSRAQPRNFALESTGWVRTVSGIQSLLSVYLLAMWLLTYFGRPFQ